MDTIRNDSMIGAGDRPTGDLAPAGRGDVEQTRKRAGILPAFVRTRPVSRVQRDGGAAMNRSTSRITDDMFARIPTLLLEGTTKAQIAAMYGVTLGTLTVLCSRRGISLRKGGALPKRTNLTLPDEPLPLSDGVLKSLRKTARAMGKDSTARLVSDLLEKIASDGLYKAVLDEEAA
jgi:hypothetical protein